MNVPVTYMMMVDGRAYTFGGIAGSFGADAAISIAACLLVGLLLTQLRGQAFAAGGPTYEPVQALPQED